MPKYEVKVTECNVAYCKVEADNHDMAEAIIEQRYLEGDAVINDSTIAMNEGGIDFDAKEI